MSATKPPIAITSDHIFDGNSWLFEHAVIVDPVRREEFTASRGRGAQLNGHRIRVSDLSSLDSALLGTGIPFKNHCDDKLQPYSKSIEVLASQCAGIRRATRLARAMVAEYGMSEELGPVSFSDDSGVRTRLPTSQRPATDFREGTRFGDPVAEVADLGMWDLLG